VGGEAYFNWPTTSETLRATIAEVDELTRYGATINTFMLETIRGSLALSMRWPDEPGVGSSRPTYLASESTWVADYLRVRRGRR
jgi:uncharacterized protein with von Willebrand factor type A (vWA) domain